ncbi:MAG: ABC transporter substrate-binding protein, partial [Ilumatobacter sp.]|uniref:ABC transporter substrate-binding protein n=1 Tax=Ilumatobacter sp. TaxID=1967498 RepID=UPI003C7753B6
MRTRTIAFAAATILTVAACGGDDESTSIASTAGATAGSTSTGVDNRLAVEDGAPFPTERCAANEAAGTVTFLTGFDYAAASSIVDVIAADAAGYYEALCLDVEIRPGFSAANYPQVASGTAQFASGGSFSEIVAFSAANDADFVAATVEGRSAIDTLITKSGTAAELSDLDGSTIGVKGKLPPSIDVMLRGAGLVEGENFDTVLLDGFDPVAHIAIDQIAGLPGWKSNEVGTLERDGIGVQLFDPLDFGVPGSFGVIFTSQSFIDEHPTAAEDFVRATTQGLADAVADPAAAAASAVALITGSGNPNFLSPEGEVFRWETEAALILDGTPEGMGLGVPDPVALQAELDAYAEVGLFGDGTTPSATEFIATDLAAGVYDAAA